MFLHVDGKDSDQTVRVVGCSMSAVNRCYFEVFAELWYKSFRE